MKNVIRIPFLPIYQICIDEIENGEFQGRLYFGSKPQEIHFCGIEKLILTVDHIIDQIGCPQANEDRREFRKTDIVKISCKERKGAVSAMRKLNTEINRGEKATFVLQVKFRQNASWQGSIQWLEEEKTLYFRSALELIKIIDSVCEQGYQVDLGDFEDELSL